MTLMRDVPMLAIDRERMQMEFENFDDMTVVEFYDAAVKRVEELARMRDMIQQRGGE